MKKSKIIDTHLLPYRRGVGMLIINQDKLAFIGKRIDAKNNYWQMPQGGIDNDETISEAVKREVYEETGIKSLEILAESKNWHYYDLPESLVPRFWNGTYRGQKLKWVLLQFNGNEKEINLKQEHPEFIEWRWVEISQLPDLVIPFKKQLYSMVVEEFQDIITQL